MKKYFFLFLPLCLALGACSSGSDDDSLTPPTQNPDISETETRTEIINNLIGHKWKGSETDYSEYSYGSSVFTQTWVVYFISENKGVMHWTTVDKDSYFGTDRSEGDSEFSYSIKGNEIQLSGDSNFCFDYYGSYLMEGETMFQPQSLDSSDRLYLLQFADNEGCPDSKHPHMIDLGLPSGTKWACCNLGALYPRDYGDFFAWGETAADSYFSYGVYEFYDNENGTYIQIGSEISGTQYDAALANWGAPWQMPTEEQFRELVSKTTSYEMTRNKVYGRLFMGKNGQSIFLPATGYCNHQYVSRKDPQFYFDDGEVGNYWSSTLYSSNGANILYFKKGKSGASNDYWASRFMGLPIRPVCQ